ncbi:hypothetical protein BH24CHL1_BH24CHL1_06640 [soil metagenome]
MTVSTDQLLDQVDVARARVFGLSGFRPGQLDAIGTILTGRDLLAVMPTGAGKSLCFQAPAVVHDGLTLVVSPLIALMKDQVDALRARDVRAAFLASGQTSAERQTVLRDVQQGQVDLLYVSPERLRDQTFMNLIVRSNVWLVAVDEAHCISTWGSDFRPDYLRIPDAIERLPSRPVIAAFTATATPRVQTDLAQKLGLQDPGRVLAGFDRPNLRFLVKLCGSPSARLGELARQVRQRPGIGIVYAGTRRATEEQAEYLSSHARSALPYHAGLGHEERTQAQEAWMSGEVDVICATNAFGLGIDKPDVRFVIHTNLPSSPDAYYQEAGRGGRDGQPSDALMLFCQSDRGLQEWMIGQDLPNVQVLQRILTFANRSEGLIAFDDAEPALNISNTTLRVGLQSLAESEAIELGARVSNEQEVTANVTRLGRSHISAIERTLAKQRAWRIEQLDEVEGYVHSGSCRREYLLSYFGDPSAAPRGDEGCCDRCARPGSRSVGDSARQAKAAKLRTPRQLSAARAELRDALVETGSVRAAAFQVGQEIKKVAEIARDMVSKGVLEIGALVPFEVQEELAQACREMDEAGIDYRRPRPGYLQSAMRFCPAGTSWDHLALYLAFVRRKEALEELGDVELEPLPVAEPRRAPVATGSTSWEASLELFLSGMSIPEVANERGFKPVTIENHLVEAIKASKLELDKLVETGTEALIRQAIEQTPPSATPLRDIRERAVKIAGRDIPYLAINAVHATIDEPETHQELVQLFKRKARAEALRADREESGQDWPESWDAEYRRILERIAELEG